MPFKVLIVDDQIDDPSEEIYALPKLLRKAGYEVRTTPDGNRAYDLFWEYCPDLVVLDIMFGNQPLGIEICAAIRQSQDDTPIILVTRFRRETKEVLAGFDAGADDYVILPCDNREIMARVRANLPPEAVLVDDYMQVDFASRRVWVHPSRGCRQVHLSPRLWQLLELLVINAGLIVPTTSIKDRVWGKAVGDSALFKTVHDLRQKVEPDPNHPKYIEVVKGIGYRFNGTLGRANSVPPTEALRSPAPSGKGRDAVVSDPDLRSRLMALAEIAVDRLLAAKSSGLQPVDTERLAREAGQYVTRQFASLLEES